MEHALRELQQFLSRFARALTVPGEPGTGEYDVSVPGPGADAAGNLARIERVRYHHRRRPHVVERAGRTGLGLTPARLIDTRQSGGPVCAGVTRRVGVVGVGGVPAVGVGSVVLNVTAASPSGAGFLTVFPSGEARPDASNVNFAAGVTVANVVVAKVGADGRVGVYNDAGCTDVVVDVAGWFASGSAAANSANSATS